MLQQSTPRETYRRVELDARVAGANPRQLVSLCYERLLEALSLALHGDAIGDNGLRSRALTQAMSALTALQLGLDRKAPIAAALGQFLGAARQQILDCVVHFDRQRIDRIRSDVADIDQAIRQA